MPQWLRVLSCWMTAFLLMASAGPAHAGSPPFRSGEKLTYHFYWGIFMVGRGTFETEWNPKDSRYYFKVQIKSNDFISAIYPVNDHLQSEWNPYTASSVRFLQDRREGSDHTWEETFFFRDQAKASTHSYTDGDIKWFDIPHHGVQDKLSTIYYMRTLDWTRREKAATTIGNDKKNQEVVMTKLRTEKIELNDFTEMPAFVVEPNTEYLGGFVKNGRMTVWITDDAHKIPVRVLAKLSVGTIRADLVKVEGVPGWSYNKEEDAPPEKQPGKQGAD